jgi:hypothetical protein
LTGLKITIFCRLSNESATKEVLRSADFSTHTPWHSFDAKVYTRLGTTEAVACMSCLEGPA